jgi:hypothetical protein
MKKKILKDWMELFPCMRKKWEYSFSRIVGPISINIGFDVEYNVEYHIEFSINNLSSEKAYPSLIGEPNYHRHALSWEQHEKRLYKEAASQLRENAYISIEGDIVLSQVIKAYEKYWLEEDFYEYELSDPPLIASWCGRNDLANKLALEYKEAWVERIYTEDCEEKEERLKNIEEWYQSLLSRLDTETLRAQVEEAIVKHKLTNLPRHELIIDC